MKSISITAVPTDSADDGGNRAASWTPIQLPAALGTRFARGVRNQAVRAKERLRGWLLESFPVAFECFFTRGNLDEPLLDLIAGHLKVRRLMARSAFIELWHSHPPLIYRPFRMYLASGFTKTTRREILTNHYSFLSERVGDRFFASMLRSPPELWWLTAGDDVFSIRLRFTDELHHEGDLLLEFRVNSAVLYNLSFTIASGANVGSVSEQALLIARLQGVPGKFDAIRRATKACRDVAPAHLLLAVVQGIANCLGVDSIAGVRNCQQLTSNIRGDPALHFDYDAFWRTFLGLELDAFYVIPVPIPEKPLDQIGASHRRRTRAKRLFKAGVAETAAKSLTGFLLAGTRPSRDLNNDLSPR